VEQAAIATDAEGTVVYWNRFAETLYGWTAEEALGRPVTLTVPTGQPQVEAAALIERLRRGESWSGEFVARNRRGFAFPVFVTDSPVHDAEGRLIGIVRISYDVSER